MEILKMRKFGFKKTGPRGERKPQGSTRLIRRSLIINNQIQHGLKCKSDYSSILKKCKQELAMLREQVIDCSKDLEIF
jgi:hypothetical protein